MTMTTGEYRPPQDGAGSRSAEADEPWVVWLRRMVLRETQVRATLERHRAVVPENVRSRYERLLRLSEERQRTLEEALQRRGQAAGGLTIAFVRAAGRLSGRLTVWGGARRILSMDIDGVRGLEQAYFDAFHEKPPADLSCVLTRFIGEIEAERSALVKIAQPLFVRS